MANPEMSRFKDLILYNLEAGEAVLTDNNDIRVYTDGKEKFRALIEEMKQAKRIVAGSREGTYSKSERRRGSSCPF